MAEDTEIAKKWPLHWMVWNSDVAGLVSALKSARNFEREQKDPRGRTPLHLAVTLGRTKCVQLLLEHGADCLAENRHQWNVVTEAVCCGQPELLCSVLSHREHQLLQERARTVPQLLDTLHASPDFYVEMKWEFTSWVPFLSRMCPSDTYKIWKKGSNVRVDTTLLGFHNMRWQRGHQSFLFFTDVSSAHMSVIDYDRGVVYDDKLSLVETSPNSALEQQIRQEAELASRLTSPAISTIFNADQLAFQRQKSGIWGFRSDRNDEVNGWHAKVFSATGVEVVTRTRTEHLPEGDKKKQKHVSPLEDFLGKAEQHSTKLGKEGAVSLPTPPTSFQQTQLAAAEYFTPPTKSEEYDTIGRRVDVAERKQQLKATMWLAEGYPLSLTDQLLPIVELMALNNTHFEKLKDFLTLQVPSGFPVKIEIPLFHIMTAKVTFGNINGVDSPAEHVSLRDQPGDHVTAMVPAPAAGKVEGLKQRHVGQSSQSSSVDPMVCIDHNQQYQKKCEISDECFKIPSDYRRVQNNMIGLNEEEELLQLAIQQSLLMQEQQSKGEGLEQPPVKSTSSTQPNTSPQQHFSSHDQFDDDLALAIALSLGNQQGSTTETTEQQQQQQQQQTQQQQTQQQQTQQQSTAPVAPQMAALSEDDILEQVLKLSLTEK